MVVYSSPTQFSSLCSKGWIPFSLKQTLVCYLNYLVYIFEHFELHFIYNGGQLANIWCTEVGMYSCAGCALRKSRRHCSPFMFLDLYMDEDHCLSDVSQLS